VRPEEGVMQHGVSEPLLEVGDGQGTKEREAEAALECPPPALDERQ
jgi:hypothetical protein